MPVAKLELIQPYGEGLPLICVQGDQANVHIPHFLGPTRPFYAFLHRGQDGRRIQPDRVEIFAVQALKELKKVLPKGPYLLCGYSFGGIMAYEMAQQLIALGDEIPLLVLMDTYAPALHDEAMKEGRRFYEPLKASVMRRLIERKWARGGTISGKLRHFHIIDTYIHAVATYEAKPYPGKLTVFKAERSWGPADLGWRSLAQGGFDLETVHGDHTTMVHEPDVIDLVDQLRRRLEIVGPVGKDRVP